jgi:GPH family glycoside/pentoside/hexuronide:cation symporter
MSGTPATPAALVAYGSPALALGFMMSLTSLYFLKFSTDVLLITPALVGIVFGLSRIWDAVTDPVVGYLSDRTRLRFGRRRSWMLAGAVPAGLFFFMLFSSPPDLPEALLTIYIAIAVFGFFTALTAVMVPHYSLGAEYSRKADARNKLFGARFAFTSLGSIGALAAIGWLSSMPSDGSEVRSAASLLALTAGLLLIAAVAALAFLVREPETPNRPMRGGIYTATRDIWGNRHARLIIIVSFIEHIGIAAMGSSSLYVAEYVMNMIEIAPVVIITFMLTSALSVPTWIKLARRFGKVRLWLGAMVCSGVTFFGLFFIAFIEQSTLQVTWLLLLAVLAGFSSGCGNTISPSLLGDVIDVDELETGERKEAAYFAVWHFAQKSASGVTIMLVGLVLSVAGFEPNVEQTRLVEIVLCGLLGIFPFVFYTLGAWLFTGFNLTGEEHARVLVALEAQQQSGGKAGA